MAKHHYISSTLIIAFFATGGAAMADRSSLSQPDQQFIEKLAEANNAEIQLGSLAEKKGGNPAVKDFGKRMVNDHTVLENQLKQWASDHSLKLKSDLSTQDVSLKNRLEKLSGKDFDREYLTAMLADHQKDVAEVQNVAETAQNPDVKKLASNTLPTLENHVRIAENVAGKIGIPANSGLYGS